MTTRYFYDCEFLEDGRSIELISIGIVAEDGREYYAVNDDMPVERIKRHEWLMENVWTTLPVTEENRLDHASPLVKSKVTIAVEVERFLTKFGTDQPELWAWYGAYDHIALMQLWGPMVEKPFLLPMWTNDLRQEIYLHPAPYLPEQKSGYHNALADAQHLKRRYDFLQEWKAQGHRPGDLVDTGRLD
ncbi:DnaQ-like DNA polymerase III subunit [Gordonia phage Pupper]|uniref:DnaQ-like DNA polymerase III subunit n=1 Tax=Gordonia phage Pupper TaxID=2571249 RepID=A0A4Y6EIJ8_9CAUD|nr:Rnase H [Gordonia phage Pupper]QDF18558.1 DnaQ-like DNA polymerase III subunit [Gordonia phage Pupper]